MKRATAAILLAGALALVPAAGAYAYNGNQSIASGTVTENLGSPAANWTITFDIHARGNGKSSIVSITQGENGPTSTFTGSVCSGSYTDPVLGGTTYYAIGPVISGNQIYGSPYETFIVHQGGPLGADRSWSVPDQLPTLADARARCETISTVSPAYELVAPTSVVFAS